MKKSGLFTLLFIVFMISSANASVILKIRAINPLEKNATAAIEYPLPKELTPEDIVEHKVIFSAERQGKDMPNISEFNVILHKEDSVYYIKQDIELLPKEIATMEVKVKDVWLIDKSNIDALTVKLKGITEEIEKDQSKQTETIMNLKNEISGEIKGIIKRQDKNLVSNVSVAKHIDAYRQNMYDLEQVFLDISMLKNLIKGTQKEEKQSEKK